ncbi:ABC transporter permease [Haloparvum sedimenti]|uniref:ABC transporter permease n=1 Tax=Haloparvum sedimenti TaxID=1678448 RepID=UPI001C4008DD|nr:ABC transporter permease [Haloparvum sedimenti]
MSIWVVFTAIFLLFAYTPDPNEAIIAHYSGEEAVEAWAAARNRDLPLSERYARWVGSYLTLDLGRTVGGEPVAAVLKRSLPITLLYVVPATVLSTVGGVAVGVYTAVRKGGYLDRFGTAVVYSGFGLPVFWLSEIALALVVDEWGLVSVVWNDDAPRYATENLAALALPTLVTAANLLAIQARYTRAEVLEVLPEEFIRTLRENGARSRDVARHALRNAAVPLVSAFCIEALGLLLVTVYVVEIVFGLPGIGALAYDALLSRDAGVVLAVTMLIAVVGVFGNLVQDLLYVALDPRIDYDER